MDKQNEVVLATQKPMFKEAVKYAVATAVATSLVAVSMSANAAEITTIGAGVNGEIDAGKSIIIELFTAGAILLGIFAGFRYLKKGANSA